MDTRRDHILRRYGVAPDARLSSGMEAEVYAYGADAVLKLYPGTASLADRLSLRDFYAGLERQRLPYALPRIHTIAHEADVLITIEQRLAGIPLSTLSVWQRRPEYRGSLYASARGSGGGAR